MPDMHPAGLPPPSAPPAAETAGVGLEPGLSPPVSRGSLARWPTFVALVIAVIGVAVGVVGWFRPVPAKSPPATPPAAPAFTEQQIADAKARVCKAFELVDMGTTLRTNPEPSDSPAMNEAQEANARLSLVVGTWELRDHLDPATPSELATAIQNVSANLLDVAANAIAGAKNVDPAQAALLEDTNSAFARIKELCK